MDTNDKFRNSLYTEAVFLKLDAEKGEGEELAETYDVTGYPTFLLLNAEGATVDRWTGYGDAATFLNTFDIALADPTTVLEKQARFDESPNSHDAEKLGDIYGASNDSELSLSMYRAALELNTGPADKLTEKIFEALYSGFYDENITLDEVLLGADAVLALDGDDHDASIVNVAMVMGRVARRHGNHELSFPYLKAALAATEGTLDEQMVHARQTLLLDKAIFIDNDMDSAVALKRDLMPEGWKEDHEGLNEFAWWCFENKTNLEEAQEYAREAVQLAESGRSKAMVLDTLAEISNELGNSGESVQLMKAALEEDPEDEYFQEQLTRFEELVAQGAS